MQAAWTHVAMTTLNFGTEAGDSSSFFGHLRSIQIYPATFSAAQLLAAST